MEKLFRFRALYDPERGWLEPGCVVVNSEGRIEKLCSSPPEFAENIEIVEGFAIPGFISAHSHAFQYAIAGRTQYAPPEQSLGDFWSWRNEMYRLALSVSPEELEIITATCYLQLLRAGFTRVVEFHYLHNNPHGKPYSNRAELSERIISAAQTVGIKLTLVPIYYSRGDFGRPPKPAQRRFIIQSTDEYISLFEYLSSQYSRPDGSINIGLGAHSVRTVAPEELLEIFSQPYPVPKHIHVSEQIREVEDAIQHLGTTPIRWLAENLPLDNTFHLVHATHADGEELALMAERGTDVVLCPTTEADLGDGIFDLIQFHTAGGNWSIGTDSNLNTSPLEELRLLDFSQRLVARRRNPLCLNPGDDSGEILFKKSLLSGISAAGLPPEHTPFREGSPLDAVVFDASHPLLSSAPPQRRLSTIIYSTDPSAILGTIVNGEWRYKSGFEQYRELLENFSTIVSKFM